MSRTFPEEQVVLDALLTEWYEAMGEIEESATDIFTERAKMYDRRSPAWDNLGFPHGFVHEMDKRILRIKQHLTSYPNDIPWRAMMDEVKDLHNFVVMFGGVSLMLERREEARATD